MWRTLSFLMVLAGCGGAGPVDGGACDEGTFDARCLSASEVAYCRGGRWVAYPCRGGCRADACSWRGAQDGDACPSMAGDRWALCESLGTMLLCDASAGWSRLACGQCMEKTSGLVYCLGSP